MAIINAITKTGPQWARLTDLWRGWDDPSGKYMQSHQCIRIMTRRVVHAAPGGAMSDFEMQLRWLRDGPGSGLSRWTVSVQLKNTCVVFLSSSARNVCDTFKLWWAPRRGPHGPVLSTKNFKNGRGKKVQEGRRIKGKALFLWCIPGPKYTCMA